MSDSFTANINELDKKMAMRLIALFFAQPAFEGKEPHEHLGYQTYSAACEATAEHLKVSSSDLRNVRNNFDKYTDRTRQGWGSSSL